MLRTTVIASLLLSSVTALAATTLYRWVDDQGRVHYSDMPRQDATEVEVAEPATFRAAPAAPPPRATASGDAAADAPAVAYREFAIVSPTPDQVLWNIGTMLPVRIDLVPSLRDGHRLQVSYNGDPVGDWPATALSHTVRNVYRGTHTISATVVDAGGKQVAAAAPVTFYVKQSSRLN